MLTGYVGSLGEDGGSLNNQVLRLLGVGVDAVAVSGEQATGESLEVLLHFSVASHLLLLRSNFLYSLFFSFLEIWFLE